MNKARSIALAVQYRSTPYSAQVQASAQVDAAEGGGSAASSASSGSGAAAGQAVTLNNTPLYVSSVAKNPATHKTGVYYFYDGILIRGRYRITNTPSRVGKTPVGQNVTGWADAADCGAVSTAKATPKKETSGQEDATLGAGTGTDIGLSIESLTYVDNAADDSDSIDLTLDAQDSKWLWGWMPQKGATLYPRLLGHDWERPGDERAIDCGLFVVDDVNYTDTPTTLQLGGVSKPSDSNFSETDRKVTWKNTSIKRIGQTIAARYGLGFTYDAEDYDIECDEQDGADSSYYNTLCQNYGLVLKVYARRLWVYDREAYKAKRAVRTFDRTGHHPWEPELDHYPFRDLHRRDLRLHRRGQGLRHLLQGGRRNAHQEREPQGHQRAGCGGPALRGAEPGQPWHDQAALHRSGRLDRECGQHNQHYRLRRRPIRRRGRHQRQVFRGQGDAQIHQERRIYHGLRVQRRPGGLPSIRGGRLHPVQHGGVRHQRHELQQLLRDEHGGQRRQRGGGS